MLKDRPQGRRYRKMDDRAEGRVSLFTIFDRVTGEIFTVIDRDFQGL